MSIEIPANAKKIRCPHCGELSIYHESNISRPFCSERCKLIDLGAWANDEYAIAGSPLVMALTDDGAMVTLPQSGADNKLQ